MGYLTGGEHDVPGHTVDTSRRLSQEGLGGETVSIWDGSAIQIVRPPHQGLSIEM